MTELEIYMKRKKQTFLLIHCRKKWQVKELLKEIELPQGNTKQDALKGWEKYQEKTCYGIMGEPLFQKPRLLFYCSAEDPIIMKEHKITYEVIWQR